MKRDSFSLVPGALGFLRFVRGLGYIPSHLACAHGRDGVFVCSSMSLFFHRVSTDGHRALWYSEACTVATEVLCSVHDRA